MHLRLLLGSAPSRFLRITFEFNFVSSRFEQEHLQQLPFFNIIYLLVSAIPSLKMLCLDGFFERDQPTRI